jgi:hypothetical protein
MEKEPELARNEIEIKPLGSYFDVDEEGYIINPTSKDKVQEKWTPVIDDAVEAYKHAYGDHLRHVYVRGSVAKGEAIEGVSDLDTFAYVDIPSEEIEHEWVDQAEIKLKESYPFVSKIELEAYPITDIEIDTSVLNQSLGVFGSDVEVPRLKIGKELAVNTPGFQKRINECRSVLEKEEDDEMIKKECVGFMKWLLRVGFEITMERSQKYTRDLYRCYETFSEYYPEKEFKMKEVLGLALNPIADKEKLKEIVGDFGMWLLEESKNRV